MRWREVERQLNWKDDLHCAKGNSLKESKRELNEKESSHILEALYVRLIQSGKRQLGKMSGKSRFDVWNG